MTKIDECLAYHAIRNSAQLLGSLTTSNLKAFLNGATHRAVLSVENFPNWRIAGVLDDEVFWRDSYELSFTTACWRQRIDLHCFDQDRLLSDLAASAEEWHELHGVDESATAYIYNISAQPLSERETLFWAGFEKRPAMYSGNITGWGLFCFLSGLTAGGDWLSLPELPRTTELFNGLQAKSSDEYGTTFAAFRAHATAPEVLRWGQT